MILLVILLNLLQNPNKNLQTSPTVYLTEHQIITEVPTELFEDKDVVISTPSSAIEEPKKIVVEEVTTEDTKSNYIGTYELTAYIATGNPCADGVYPQVGYTVACNDSRLWHKTIYIEGYGTYYVHDTGGMSSNVIDIFVGSYDEAIQFGRRSAGVYIVE